MKHLEVSKTSSLILPSYTKAKFVRTGVPRENHLSFIHCMLHASFNDYSTKSLENKNKMAELVKQKIAIRITKADWEHFGSEWREKYEKLATRTIEEIYFFLKLLPRSKSYHKSKTVDRIFNRIIKNKDIEKYMPMYQVLLKEISLDNFTDNKRGIFSRSFDSCVSRPFEECKDMITVQSLYLITKILKHVDIHEKKKEIFSVNFIYLIKTVLSEVETEIVQKIKDDIRSSNRPLNLQVLKTISDMFERDVYFVDGSTLLPFVPACWSNKGNRHFIVLLMVGATYEIIGRVIDDSNKVQRNFPPDDPLLSAFLNKKKKNYHRAKSVSSSSCPETDSSSSVSELDPREDEENVEQDEEEQHVEQDEEQDEEEDEDEDKEEDEDEDKEYVEREQEYEEDDEEDIEEDEE